MASSLLSSDSALEIERIQACLYQALGRDPAIIPEQIERHLSDTFSKASQYGLDAESLEKVRGEYSRWRTTKYQDPTILGPIALDWGKIVESARIFKADAVIRVGEPKIATVPIGLLNGLAIKDAKGSYGIMVQEGLRFWPLLIATAIHSAITEETEGGIKIDINPTSLRRKCSMNWKYNSELLGLFVKDAIIDGMLAPKDVNDRPDLTAASFGEASIASGFKSFVLAHEYSHCLNDHVGQLIKDTSHGYVYRPKDQFDRVRSLTLELDPDTPVPTKEQIYNYMHRQMMEIQADAEALAMLTALFARENFDEAKAYLHLLGALSFFWYAELTERVHRTIEYGSDWIGKREFTTHAEVSNLLTRISHPHPLTRFEHAAPLAAELLGQMGPPFLGMANQCWAALSAIFETAWEENMEALLGLIARDRPILNAKWDVNIPSSVAVLGLDCRSRTPYL